MRVVFLSLAVTVAAGVLTGPSLGASRFDAPVTAHVAGGESVLAPRRPRKPAAAATVIPTDPLWRGSWSLVRVGAPAAWRLTTGTATTVVAVLDTGVAAGHPDLRGALVPGWDAVGDDADAEDDHGHGTLVAGVIAARANNGIGLAGTCWQCSLMPVKVIGADGTGSAGDVAEGIVWAVDHGAHVVNMSLVLSGYDEGVAAAIRYARSRNVVVVAAAGNSGDESVTFPASEPGVLSVAASDAADMRYPWATFGGWVAVAAPGCSPSTDLGGGYGEFCGSSSATAVAAGVAALARSAAPGSTADAVVDALVSTARPVDGFVAGGRIDAAAALHAPSLRCCAPAGPADNPLDRPAPRRNPL